MTAPGPQATSGPTRCPYDPVDQSSVATTQQLLDATVVCLMSLWEPALTQAGYDLPRPPVYLAYTDVQTPCGTVSFSAFAGLYCPLNGAIYIAYPQTAGRRADGQLTYVVETVLAHEFGHHLTSRTGMLAASYAVINQATTSAAVNEEWRRLELQADCFAAMAISSMAHSYGLNDADVAALTLDASRRSDAHHGVPASIILWFRTGLEAGGRIGRCNTYAASSTDVA